MSRTCRRHHEYKTNYICIALHECKKKMEKTLVCSECLKDSEFSKF